MIAACYICILLYVGLCNNMISLFVWCNDYVWYVCLWHNLLMVGVVSELWPIDPPTADVLDTRTWSCLIWSHIIMLMWARNYSLIWKDMVCPKQTKTSILCIMHAIWWAYLYHQSFQHQVKWIRVLHINSYVIDDAHGTVIAMASQYTAHCHQPIITRGMYGPRGDS